MALVQPAFIVAKSGQALDVVMTVAGNTTGWAISAELRTSAKSAAALVTKTVGSGIVNTPGGTSTLTISFSSVDLTLTPGAYVWSVERTDASEIFPIADESTFFIEPADGSAYPQLTNVSELLVNFGFSETVTDADAKFYLQMIAAAEQTVRDLTGRNFNYGTYTEYPRCHYQRAVQLREPPVRTTDIDVRYDYARVFGTDTVQTYGTDCLLELGQSGFSETGLLYRLGSVWNGSAQRPMNCLTMRPMPAIGILKVTYLGGYQLIPEPIKVAIWETVADRMAARGLGVGLQSESGMQYSYSRGDWSQEAAKLLSVQQVVSTYRRGDLWVG